MEWAGGGGGVMDGLFSHRVGGFLLLQSIVGGIRGEVDDELWCVVASECGFIRVCKVGGAVADGKKPQSHNVCMRTS